MLHLWGDILLAGVLLGLWRAYDGTGKYLPGFWRGCIGVAVLIVIVQTGGLLRMHAGWELNLCGLVLVAVTFWGLQRHMEDWTDLEYIVPHFVVPIFAGAVPYVAWMAVNGRPAAIAMLVPTVALAALSGVVFPFQVKLFSGFPRFSIGEMDADVQRWTEFSCGFLQGVGISLLLHWAEVIYLTGF